MKKLDFLINTESFVASGEDPWADVYAYSDAQVTQQVKGGRLRKMLVDFPNADITARVVFSIVDQTIVGKGFWPSELTLLRNRLQIGVATYVFPRPVLDAFTIIASTGDFDAILSYAKHTVDTHEPSTIFRYIK